MEDQNGIPCVKKAADLFKNGMTSPEIRILVVLVYPVLSLEDEDGLGGLFFNTFESKKQKGLYFVGECLNATGELGGYNFQLYFAQGAMCAKHF